LIAEETFSEEELDRFSTAGCLQTTVLDALTQGVIKPQLSGKKWSEICRSNASVPNFKRKIPVCIRCDKPRHKKVFVDDDRMDALDALK
jgi:hypothetical protein